MSKVILLDFGSTFTKAAVVCLEEKKIIFTTKTPSTVKTNAKDALDICYKDIKDVIGEKEFQDARKLATSSAAGGLRMIVIGLTPTLSITAGKNAALGAGAKILKSYSGLLTDEDAKEMESLNAEIILLCGGYENGNTTAVLHNAEMLGNSNIRVPIIYAGNSSILREIRTKLSIKSKECFMVNNIIPNVGEINSEQAEELIRNIFMKRITNMKGLDKVKSALDTIMMPTPASVLEAGNLLSKGYGEIPGLGSLMIVDIGGATTDIHTYAESNPIEGVMRIVGSPEPYAKRTVEGDLGIRESSGLVIGEIGYDIAAGDLGISGEQLKKSIKLRLDNINFLSKDNPCTEELELKIDQQIARYAARISARRHVGKIEYIHTKVSGIIQRGKNLSGVGIIIGTGGPIINSRNPREILEEVLINNADKKMNLLLPEKAKIMVDKDYVFYAAGILKHIDPEAALAVMLNSLVEV